MSSNPKVSSTSPSSDPSPGLPNKLPPTHSPLPHKSNVRALLGITGMRAATPGNMTTGGITLVTSVDSLPKVDLPYVQAQGNSQNTGSQSRFQSTHSQADAPLRAWQEAQWEDFAEDNLEEQDEWDAEISGPSVEAQVQSWGLDPLPLTPQPKPQTKQPAAPPINHRIQQQTNPNRSSTLNPRSAEVPEALAAGIERIQTWIEAIPGAADTSSLDRNRTDQNSVAAPPQITGSQIAPVTSLHIPGTTSSVVPQSSSATNPALTNLNNLELEGQTQLPSLAAIAPPPALPSHLTTNVDVSNKSDVAPKSTPYRNTNRDRTSDAFIADITADPLAQSLSHHPSPQLSNQQHLTTANVVTSIADDATAPHRSMTPAAVAPVAKSFSPEMSQAISETLAAFNLQSASAQQERSEQHSVTQKMVMQKMAAQIEQLEQVVADLSSQMVTQKEQQKHLSTPGMSSLPQINQPRMIMQRPAQPGVAHAFWERSYTHRLYRWSRR